MAFSASPYYALVSTGCHEIILIGDGSELHCDLRDAPFESLERLLNELNAPNA